MVKTIATFSGFGLGWMVTDLGSAKWCQMDGQMDGRYGKREICQMDKWSQMDAKWTDKWTKWLISINLARM